MLTNFFMFLLKTTKVLQRITCSAIKFFSCNNIFYSPYLLSFVLLFQTNLSSKNFSRLQTLNNRYILLRKEKKNLTKDFKDVIIKSLCNDLLVIKINYLSLYFRGYSYQFSSQWFNHQGMLTNKLKLIFFIYTDLFFIHWYVKSKEINLEG